MPAFVKEWRKYRRLTQETTAERMGTTGATIARLENSKRRLTVEWLEKFAQCFEIRIQDIFSLPSEQGRRPQGKIIGSRVQILEITRCPDGFQMTGKAIDSVGRPSGLEHCDGAYAVFAPDNSMAPQFAGGCLMFVHPYRCAELGDAAIVKYRSSGGPEIVGIGILECDDGETVALKSHHGSRQTMMKASVVNVGRIMTTNELFADERRSFPDVGLGE